MMGRISGGTGVFEQLSPSQARTVVGLAASDAPTFAGASLSGLLTLTGGQIAFPATQSASSDANTLDDYEEGTWSPTLTCTPTDFTSVTYAGSRQGAYVKIGKWVFLTGYMLTSAITVGPAAGSLVIGGLPYQPAGRVGLSLAFSSAFAANNPIGALAAITNFFYLAYKTTANGGSATNVPSDAGTGANANQFYFSAFYATSA